MKRPRLTVRRLMVGVAIAAFALGLDGWRRRFAYCEGNQGHCVSAERVHLWLAEGHTRVADRYRELAANRKGSHRYNIEQASVFDRAVRAEQAEAKRAAERGEAFRRAALYPWVPLPPIEPEGIGRVDPERGAERAADRPPKARGGLPGH